MPVLHLTDIAVRALKPTDGYQYRARYYDPVLGIFLSMDPIGTKDDPNLYGYVANDPVNKTDPTGLYECTLGGRRCDEIERALQRARREAEKYEAGSTKRIAIQTTVDFFGRRGQRNGVVIRRSRPNELKALTGAQARHLGGRNVEIVVNRNLDLSDSATLGGVLVHEGNHGYNLVRGRSAGTSRAGIHNFEVPAYRIQFWLWAAMGHRGYSMSTSDAQINTDADNGAARSAGQACLRIVGGCDEQRLRGW